MSTVAATEAPLSLERHGIDYIPPGERHGRPYTLFTFWAASNVQILAISVGVLAIVFGLSLPWAIFAIIVGNAAGGLYMALHSVQGPRLGLPQMMQSRAQFGMYGTALPNIIVVLMYIGYFTSSAILGGQAVASLFHVTTAEGIIIINAFVLLVVWFGYDMFHSYNKVVTWLSTAIFLAILGKLLTVLPAHLPAGDNSAGNVLLAISVFVAWQVTWAPYVSDYSRYMPETTSSWKTFTYTYLGSVVGGSLVMCIGAIAAVVAKAAVSANAPDYLGGLLAAKWLFLIIFILGVGSGNFGNLYGPFLTFMAIISPSGRLASKTTGRAARLVATTVVAVIGTVIAIKASSNFITDLSNFLVFTLYLLVPWTAINLTDFYLIRHGRYDIPELFKTDGRYGRFNWYALVVYALAVGIQFPFMNDPAVYVGPVSTALGGADIAWIVGFVVAAVAYYAGARYRMSAAARPKGPAVLVPGPPGGAPGA
ncbi:MAG TPA: cytosine permease [Streptosporangiaceae bacterium]|jgi:NCS1 family nucleobase:cation symporter-1|nr:cytosine permease [Streptosporangiaceae bacterium]